MIHLDETEMIDVYINIYDTFQNINSVKYLAFYLFTNVAKSLLQML